MNKSVRIVLVDGRELVRYGLRGMLELEEDMQVVGNYASAEEALIEVARLHPDIMLMGTQLPGINWIEATHSLKRNRPSHGGDVVILGESPDYQARALEAGAASYLLKDIAGAELAQVIRQVYRNRHSSKECDGLVEEVVELMIPPPASAACLIRFMCQLGVTFQDDFAGIICTVGSWDQGTVITIRLQPTMSSRLLFYLANMPEVDKVEEGPVTRGVFSSFARKLRLQQRLGINPSKRIHIILKETDMATRELATVVN